MLRIGQVEPSATADGKYTDGSVAGGIAATRLRAAAFNAMQEELANIVESAGMILSPDDMTQVLTALKKQLLSRANPFADIKADGPAAVAAALSNLGLGEAAKRAVGTGENQIPDMSSFPLTVTGDLSSRKLTTKLPNGLILKAVNGNADSNGWFSLNFDTPFPSEILFCWAADRLPVSAQNQLSVINANINLSAVDHVAGHARAVIIGGGVGPVAASISAYALGR